MFGGTKWDSSVYNNYVQRTELLHSQLDTPNNSTTCHQFTVFPPYVRIALVLLHLRPIKILIYFYDSATAPIVARPPLYGGFIIILRHTTVNRTPLDEWSARRRDLYLRMYDTHDRHTSMPPAEFEPTIIAGEPRRPMSWTARPLGPEKYCFVTVLYYSQSTHVTMDR